MKGNISQNIEFNYYCKTLKRHLINSTSLKYFSVIVTLVFLVSCQVLHQIQDFIFIIFISPFDGIRPEMCHSPPFSFPTGVMQGNFAFFADISVMILSKTLPISSCRGQFPRKSSSSIESLFVFFQCYNISLCNCRLHNCSMPLFEWYPPYTRTIEFYLSPCMQPKKNYKDCNFWKVNDLTCLDHLMFFCLLVFSFHDIKAQEVHFNHFSN